MKLLSIITVLVIITACNTNNNTNTIFTITADNFDLIDAPVHTDLKSGVLDGITTLCLSKDDHKIPAQIENLTDDEYRIWWLANLKAGEMAEYTLLTGEECPSTSVFTWVDLNNHSKKLNQNGQPILQYEFPRYDSNNIEATKKPYHHVFDPESDRLITKGPGGLYTHHRGIFFGYNHVYTENQPDTRIDIWHARDGERSEHEQFIREYSGPVMGGHAVKIYWKDLEGTPFIEEVREIRAFKQTGSGIIVDFHSTLNAIDQSVRLEGDLQHAGVQFRAAQYVADNSDQTRFIRPDEWSHVSSEEEIGEEDRIDLPWNAMNFQIEDNLYTVLYMSHPANPDGAEMSERRYGRFGEFFPYEITPDDPLTVQYRFWIKRGTSSTDELELIYNAYASPPEVNMGR